MKTNQYAIGSKVWWNGQQWNITGIESNGVRVLELGDQTRRMAPHSLDRVPANNGGQYTITEPRR